MAKSNLVKVIYQDTGKGIFLECYADTIVYQTAKGGEKTLFAIRMGGYPEQVRAMSDAIYAGSTIFFEQDEGGRLSMNTLTKQYDRKLSMDGVYAEATLFVKDEPEVVPTEEQQEGQTTLGAQRDCYLFTPAGDRERLFDEIDLRTGAPLIREFQDYFLDALMQKEILVPLSVYSVNEHFDAWRLTCTADDKNLIGVLEEGLRSGAIEIPGATPENSEVFNEIYTISQYLHEFGVSLAERIKEQFTPLFDPAKEPVSNEVLLVNENIRRNCGYRLYDAQLACAESLKRKIDRHEPAIIVAECGAGKTKIGMTALYASHLAAGKEKTFNIVLCPSHVAKKWVREIKEGVPNSIAAVIGGITDLQKLYKAYENGHQTAFAVISKEKARDSYSRYPSVQWNSRKKCFLCPVCHQPIMVGVSEDSITYESPAAATDFLKENRQNHKCRSCGTVLWAPLTSDMQTDWVKIGGFGFVHRRFPDLYFSKTKSRTIREQIAEVCRKPNAFYAAVGAVRRFALSSYIKRKMRGKIDGAILDELHQFNNDSGQGDAMGEIARTADKVIGMTATLINGYASGIFHLLYRLFPEMMELDGQKHSAPNAFSKEYGMVESIFEVAAGEYNTNRRTAKRKLRERQLPGISPLVYSRFLLENAVFLSLADMGKDLPEYEEIPIELKMRDDVREEYLNLTAKFRKIMRSDRKISQKVMSAFMGLLTVYPDQPYDQPPIRNPLDKREVLVEPQNLSSFDELHEKDVKLLELVGQKMARGERVLIYTSWVRIDTQKKLLKLFAEKGYRAAALPASVSPQKREEWVEKQLQSGIRILITNPSLVETGLDLNAFTTLIYYNIGYNLFTLRQSSRRSWRINQTAPRIEVYFFFYEGTMQARAMRLMASKLAAAGVLEGNVTDEGLAAMSDCQDLTSELAKELTLGIQDEVEDLSAVFKRMAIFRPGGEMLAPESPTDEKPLQDNLEQPEPVRIFAELDTEAEEDVQELQLVFSVPSRRRRRTREPVFCEDQLSLFDKTA